MTDRLKNRQRVFSIAFTGIIATCLLPARNVIARVACETNETHSERHAIVNLPLGLKETQRGNKSRSTFISDFEIEISILHYNSMREVKHWLVVTVTIMFTEYIEFFCLHQQTIFISLGS